MSLRSDLLKQARFGGRLLVWGPPVGPIKKLFANGEQGVWYDPSDLSTLFQDATGTTPVTSDGDPVGLMLDKSGNGNHATQSVSASRPTYRTGDERGVINLVKWSEGMENHRKSSITIESDNILGAQGRLNADKVVPNTTNSQHSLTVSNEYLSGETYTASVYVKAGGYGGFVISFPHNAFGNWIYSSFNLENGTVIAGNADQASISYIGDGWYLCSITDTATKDIISGLQIKVSDNPNNTSQGPSFAGDGTSGVYISGVQAEKGTVATTYQRNDSHLGGVGTGLPTDLHWLEFDGVDDYLSAGDVLDILDENIIMCAGYYGARAVIAGKTAAANEVGRYFMPYNNDTTFTQLSSEHRARYAFPVNSALTTTMQVLRGSTNTLSLRHNGSVVASRAVAPDMVSYNTSRPFWIGAYPSTTETIFGSPMDGNLYGLVTVRKSGDLGAENLDSLEGYISDKSGVTL